MCTAYIALEHADNRTQLVLEVDGPALASVQTAYGIGSSDPAYLQAKAEAEAWAGGLKEGVATSLGLASGACLGGWNLCCLFFC